jgi:AcrR family transcriptional regulator
MERKSIDQKTRSKPSGAAVFRADLTDALHRAFFEEWAEKGYAAISLERIASRAGAGKAAIYRRWHSKRDFALEAIEAAGITLADFADHGSLEADITAYLMMTRKVLRHRLVRRIVPDLVAERMRSGDLAEILATLSAARRSRGHAMIDRAISRNEVSASIDRELAFDFIPAPLYWRTIVRGKAVNRQDIDRQVVALLAALRAC